jgi:hypothetical protein
MDTVLCFVERVFLASFPVRSVDSKAGEFFEVIEEEDVDEEDNDSTLDNPFDSFSVVSFPLLSS